MKNQIVSFRLDNFISLEFEDKNILESWLDECEKQFRKLIEFRIKPVLVNKYNSHYSKAIIIQIFFPLLAIKTMYEKKNGHLEHLRSELMNWYNSMTTPISEQTDFQHSDIPGQETLFTRNNGGWECPDNIDVATLLSTENPVDCINCILFRMGNHLKNQVRKPSVSVKIPSKVENTTIELVF